jgi:hypothetical protein
MTEIVNWVAEKQTEIIETQISVKQDIPVEEILTSILKENQND